MSMFTRREQTFIANREANNPMPQYSPLTTHDADEDARNRDIKIYVNGDYCMNGVTRQKVIDLCRDNGIPVCEKNVSLYEAYGADEAFLTGTFDAQTSGAEIDGKSIGSGKRPLTQRIRALYKELIAQNVIAQKTAM